MKQPIQDLSKSKQQQSQTTTIQITKRPLQKSNQQKSKQAPIKKKRKMLSFQDQILQSEQVSKSKTQNQTKPNFKKPKTQTSMSSELNQNLTFKLQQQFLVDFQKNGEELFELDYSFWGSSQIKKKIKRKKKETILQLLKQCRLQLIPDFQSLVKVSPQNLIFVIKDFIAPHNISINQIQMLGIKTKNGHPLFSFHKTILKKEGKQFQLFVNLEEPIKIIEKTHYQKNKNVFPFATWHTIDIQKLK